MNKLAQLVHHNLKQVLRVTAHPQILVLELRAPMGACLGQYGMYIHVIDSTVTVL